MRIFCTIILVLLLVYGYSEFKRWQQPDLAGVLTDRQKRRRKFCFAALIVVIGMAIGATFFPTEHITKRFAAIEMVYWSVCLISAAIIPIAVMREFRETLQQENLTEIRHERNEAYREMVESVAAAEIESKRRNELPTRNGHG